MGFGDSLKKWAQAKATELVTADSGTRADAAAEADAARSQARSDLGETLFRTAFPKVGEWADRQEAAKVERASAAEAERRAEVAALPVATVAISVTGHTTGEWSGPLHYAWNDVEAGEADPSDPYADRPSVWFELFAEDGAEPPLGSLHLSHWSFQLPGWHGDGGYDLTAIARERETAGAALDYLEWGMDFADADDASFYFHPAAPQSSVTVSGGGTTLAVSIAMSGALGDLAATATITLPAAPAAG